MFSDLRSEPMGGFTMSFNEVDRATVLAEALPYIQKYNGKVVKFKGIVCTDTRLPKNSVIIGRHIMTCCADDIKYGGMVCVFNSPQSLKTKDWITVKGTIKIEKSVLYKAQGPVLYVDATEFAVAPKQEVATFY